MGEGEDCESPLGLGGKHKTILFFCYFFFFRALGVGKHISCVPLNSTLGRSGGRKLPTIIANSFVTGSCVFRKGTHKLFILTRSCVPLPGLRPHARRVVIKILPCRDVFKVITFITASWLARSSSFAKPRFPRPPPPPGGPACSDQTPSVPFDKTPAVDSHHVLRIELDLAK